MIDNCLAAKTAPIALPNDANDDPAPDDPVTLSGWGKVSDDTHQESDELLKVQVPVIYNEDCRMEYPLDEYEGVICVDTVNGTMGICNVSSHMIRPFNRLMRRNRGLDNAYNGTIL